MSHFFFTVAKRVAVSPIPDKREVVSSILTRPISNLLLRKHLRTAPRGAVLLFAVDCTQIVNKNVHLIARFVAVTTRSRLASPYHKTTYNAPSTQRKRGGVYTNCRQKILQLVSGRGFSA